MTDSGVPELFVVDDSIPLTQEQEWYTLSAVALARNSTYAYDCGHLRFYSVLGTEGFDMVDGEPVLLPGSFNLSLLRMALALKLGGRLPINRMMLTDLLFNLRVVTHCYQPSDELPAQVVDFHQPEYPVGVWQDIGDALVKL